MKYFERYQQEFNSLKENKSETEERLFHEIIEQIDIDTSYLFEQAEKHPKYNFEPTKEIPASIELDKLDKLKKEIKNFMKNSRDFDPEEELDSMFPDRHDEDFDDDSMNYDSVFGKDKIFFFNNRTLHYTLLH